MDRIIFGDENAKNDSFLYDCVVPLPAGVRDKPVLEGRWGVGKTATFFIRHKSLMDKLSQVNPTLKHIWYLDEGGLDTDTLFSLGQHFAGNNSLLKRALEQLWRAEIARVLGRQLSVLYEHYGSPNGSHWNYILSKDRADSYLTPVWTGLSKLIPIAGANIGNAVTNAIGAVSAIFDEVFEKNLQLCLADIKDEEIQPVVVIEPIETPLSALEEADMPLSRMVVVSLLDLFILKLSYSPYNGQWMRLQISVPWHRDVSDYLREPQKRQQFFGEFNWSKEMLREFINKRIEKEFEMARRQFKPKKGEDAWSTLFTENVRNLWCGVDENSFDYFLRHTHHRARDLLRLARDVVKAQVDHLEASGVSNASAESVFKASHHDKISPTSIRTGIASALSFTAGDRLTEAKRRFGKIGDVTETLFGIQNPVSIQDIKTRVGRATQDTEDALKHLWEVGVIGVELIPDNTRDAIEILEKNIGEEGIAFHSKPGEAKHNKKYFLFEYNTRYSFPQILNLYSHNGGELKIVIHPVFTEHFGCAVQRNYPIGV